MRRVLNAHWSCSEDNLQFLIKCIVIGAVWVLAPGLDTVGNTKVISRTDPEEYKIYLVITQDSELLAVDA